MTAPTTELEAARAMTRAGIAGKIADLRARHIATDRDHDLSDQLDRLLQLDASGRQIAVPVRFTAEMETRGITLIEPAGGGKTTAVRRLLSKNAALNPAGGPARHLHVQVPSPATLKSLGLEILRSTGFQGVAARTTAWDIWGIVRHRLSVLGIAVLWIDEAHDMFLSGSAREIDDMLKMLKSLMLGEAGVILILSGTGRLSEMTSYDPQVDRRFTKVVPTDLVVGGHEDKVGKLVADYARRAGLGLEWSDEMSGRLIRASRGRFGRAVETVVNAIERALLDGVATLTATQFAEAWGMQEGCAWHDNLFIARDWSVRVLDGAAEEFDAARTLRQRKKLERS